LDSFSEKLQEELVNEIAFTIPIPGTSGIPVASSVVGTWIIMAVILVVAFIMTRKLSVVPTTKRQLLLEIGIGWLNKFFGGILGEKGKRYIPFLSTVIVFIGAANISGIFGLSSPTKDLGVTAGLAVLAIVLIEYSTFAAKGGKGFLKSFAQPTPIMLPINIMEIGIRPLSLCMRLFGNVLGSFVVMTLLEIVFKGIMPLTLPFSFYFDIFDGFIQAYVFVFLTSLFMAEGLE
jgi:F-type H+-transporting ATPase subunit a